MRHPASERRLVVLRTALCGGQRVAGAAADAGGAVGGGDDEEARAIEERMHDLRAQLDALQLKLGSLSADAPLGAGGDDNSALTTIAAAHRSAVADVEQLRHASSGDGVAPVEMREFFRRFGYWVVPDAVQGEALARLQRAWLRESAAAREVWEAEKSKGQEPQGMGFAGGTWVARTYFDLPRFAEADPSFRDLLDNPRVFPLIRSVMGGSVVLDQIQVGPSF